MSKGWQCESHLVQTIQHTCSNSSLNYMGVPTQSPESGPDKDMLGDKAVQLSWHILSRRAWSLTKHSTPPECYAGILSEDIAAAQSVAENMQSDFEQNLTPLELCAHKNHTAQKLFNDLIFPRWIHGKLSDGCRRQQYTLTSVVNSISFRQEPGGTSCTSTP